MNGGNPNYRNIPDVAAEANTDNYFCSSGSCQGGIGGTSLAAPRWAGFVALVNQQAAANATAAGSNPTLGLLNPTIYDTAVDADFHDMTSGSNYNSSSPSGCTSSEFSAGTGLRSRNRMGQSERADSDQCSGSDFRESQFFDVGNAGHFASHARKRRN